MNKTTLKEQLKELKERISKTREVLALPLIEEEVFELEKKTQKEDFWENKEKAQEVLKKLESSKKTLEKWKFFHKEINELYHLSKMAFEEEDKEVIREIEKRKKELEDQFKEEEIKTFLSGTYDKSNVYLSIHSGAGGQEACDWAGMLLRMYLRFSEKMNFQGKIVDETREEEGGIKNATLYIEGPFAYGLLKGEAGVHRLVRISPFDADRARHTSFALVEVLPEIEEEKVEIKEEDIKVETFRSSGPGGQHANVTASAVRITHIPTKISAVCQSERSQFQNRITALRILKSKLTSLHLQEKKKEKEKIKGKTIPASWGRQIRSYILHPYKLVKDHRINFEWKNPEEVLDGQLLPFVEQFLQRVAKKSF